MSEQTTELEVSNEATHADEVQPGLAISTNITAGPTVHNDPPG
jgi:hypothetical protein